jgi:apolipoprotein N-acyltransferase
MRPLVLSLLFFVGLAVSLASFPTAHAHLLGMAGVCFVPLIVALKTTQNKWRQLTLSWLFFQIFFLILFWYSPPKLPDGFFHMDPFSAIWLLFLAPPILYAIAFWGTIRIQRYLGTTLGSLWGIWAMTGVVEWLILDRGFQFPLSLAITVYDQPAFLQIASVGGWMAISAWLWGCNFILGFLLDTFILHIKSGGPQKCISRLTKPIISICILSLPYIWGVYRLHTADAPERHIHATLIQPNFSWDTLGFSGISKPYFENTMSVIADMTRQAKTLKSDIILFPEAIFARSLNQEDMRAPLNETLSTIIPPVVVVGNTHGAGNTSHNSAVLFENGQYKAFRHKKSLVPMIENDLTIPTEAQQPFYDVIADLNIGPLICFELMSNVPLELVKTGADILTCHANTAYFGNSNWPFLHAAYLPIRAAELGRSSILVNNTGFSLATDAYGRLVGRSQFNQKQILNYKLPIIRKETVYAAHPFLFIIVLWTAGGFLSICLLKKTAQGSHDRGQ